MIEDFIFLVIVIGIIILISISTNQVINFKKKSMNNHKPQYEKTDPIGKIIYPLVAIIGILSVFIFGRRNRDGPLYEWFMSLF